MAKLYVLALFTVLGSVAAAADDRVEAAAAKLFGCTESAARSLAQRDGLPEILADRALDLCRAEHKALKRLVGKRGADAVRAVTKAANVALIERERRRHGWASNPAEKEIYCASCGFLPRWDDKLRVWRPYPHNR
jgi:hypothetical protein